MIRDFKNFNPEKYITDFKLLPLNLFYAIDDPDEQVSFLNQFILQCIDDHAPLKKTKLTRPPATWMKSEIVTKYTIFKIFTEQH